MLTYKCYDEPPQYYKDRNDSLSIRLWIFRSKSKVKKTKDFNKDELS